MDPVITGQPGREHPLARHLDDFLVAWPLYALLDDKVADAEVCAARGTVTALTLTVPGNPFRRPRASAFGS
jgi:hypothetical protein